MLNAVFQERLATRLKELKMSQTELARRVGVSQATISRLIKGDYENSRYIVSIAEHLGVTAEWLIGKTSTPQLEIFGTKEAQPAPAPTPGNNTAIKVKLMYEQVCEMLDKGAITIDQASDMVDALAKQLETEDTLKHNRFDQARKKLINALGAAMNNQTHTAAHP